MIHKMFNIYIYIYICIYMISGKHGYVHDASYMYVNMLLVCVKFKYITNGYIMMLSCV